VFCCDIMSSALKMIKDCDDVIKIRTYYLVLAIGTCVYVTFHTLANVKVFALALSAKK
jgi:hypothetical protein